MATTYTYRQIANNWNLWQEYIDPNAVMTEDEFDEMSEDEKMKLQTDSFGAEILCESCLQGDRTERPATTHSKNPEFSGYELCQECADEYDSRMYATA